MFAIMTGAPQTRQGFTGGAAAGFVLAAGGGGAPFRSGCGRKGGHAGTGAGREDDSKFSDCVPVTRREAPPFGSVSPEFDTVFPFLIWLSSPVFGVCWAKLTCGSVSAGFPPHR